MTRTDMARAVGLAALVAGVATARIAHAQPTRTDYARAEQLLPWNVQDLIVDDAIRPRWMPGDRFWYRNRGTTGWEFLVVDMARCWCCATGGHPCRRATP